MTSRRVQLAAIMVLALGLRLIAVLFFPSLNHPDETFQLFEPAHRLAFGWGVKTWEFYDGIRSMVPPAILALVFRLADPVVGGPRGYIDAARMAVALLSLLPVAVIWRMGERESRVHALIAALVVATWFEIVYFSIRPLTEALACDFALTALALASRPYRDLTPRVLAGTGLCLALTVLLRLQLAPGAALVAFWVGRLEIRRRWAPMALGAVPALAVFGVADWLTWGAPFASYVRAVAVNLGAGKASVYGVQSWSWYLSVNAALWGPFVLVAIALCAIRWRRSRLWIAFAAIEIAVHSAIPHKEYRFVYPALAALVVTAALGSADLVVRFGPRIRSVRPAWLTGAVAGAWLITSLALAVSPQFRPEWTLSRGPLESEFWLAGRPDLCGVLFYDSAWTETGGYAYLHRRVPLYFPTYAMRLGPGDQLRWPIDMEARRRRTIYSEDAFNYVVAAPSSLSQFEPRYRPSRCFGYGEAVCVAERPGGCAPEQKLTPILAVPRLGEPVR
jgi:hypothetical protein